MTSSFWRTSAKLLVLVSVVTTAVSCGRANALEPAGPKAAAYDDLESRIKIREANPVSEAVIGGMNQFALASASRVLSTEKGSTLYSPYSLYVALALAAAGAEGTTKEEMTDLLGGSRIGDTTELAGEVGNLIRQLHTDNKIGRLKTANSIWAHKGHTFRKEYEELAAQSFYASLHQADFGKKETAEEMGRWVRDHTSGQITPEINLDPSQILALINTLDFKDEWSDAFNESSTAQGPFYPEEGNPVTASFMSRTFFTTAYAKGEGYASASLGLKNGGAMTFVLPDKGVNVKELVASPDKAKSLLQVSGQQMRKLTLKLPKFDYSTEMGLNQALQGLGMRTAFTEKADFSKMSDTPVFISLVKQNAHIAIDEKGVEAAAFTQILMVGSAMPNGEPAELILDRPFLFSITAPNGTILFTGICRQP
ncbi:MAG: proteinase inhibitor serpin [Paenibacillaceae bacterium]|nr:proteinase inhibitor serpin [Paenibacillaceae bacterium]